jgi:hypothetical protein
MTTAAPEPSWRSAISGGMTRWFPIVGSIGAWAVHLVALASLVRYTCNAPAKAWTLHAVTIGCLVVAGAALVLAVRLMRAGAGRRRDVFLGQVSALVALINIALIALEEVYVVALHGHTCG